VKARDDLEEEYRDKFGRLREDLAFEERKLDVTQRMLSLTEAVQSQVVVCGVSLPLRRQKLS